MKILGVNALNANNYRMISVHKNVNVLGSSNKSALKIGEEFSASLRGKSDEEKRDAIVRYFLENHKIATLFEGHDEIIIQSESGIELSIDRDKSLSKEVLREVTNKYDIDRMNTYANEEVDFYWLVSSLSTFSTELGYCVGSVNEFERKMKGLPEEFTGKKCMVMDIGIQKKFENGELKGMNIAPNDKEFLNKMLSDMKDISFYCYSDDLFRNSVIFKCKIDDREAFVVISRELGSFVYDIDEKIEKESKDKSDCKKLQYKMEGF